MVSAVDALGTDSNLDVRLVCSRFLVKKIEYGVCLFSFGVPSLYLLLTRFPVTSVELLSIRAFGLVLILREVVALQVANASDDCSSVIV